MEYYLQLTIHYLEGILSVENYEMLVDTDDGLYQWIQSIVPKGKLLSYCTPPSTELVYYPYDIRMFMKLHERLDYGGPRGSLGFHYYMHNEIASLIQLAFPNLTIKVDTRPKMLFNLRYACPRYIGGTEVARNNILTKLLSDIPTDWAPSRQAKVAKERIKKAFHIEGNEYPHWVQDAEWPVNNGKPMKYLRTIRITREYLQHIFMDVDSGVIRSVDDFS